MKATREIRRAVAILRRNHGKRRKNGVVTSAVFERVERKRVNNDERRKRLGLRK